MRAVHVLPTLALLLLAACGGGGGGPEGPTGPAPDLTGWWQESTRDLLGDGDLLPFRLVELTDDGETVLYEGRTLVKTGWSIRLDRPDADDPDRSTWWFDILGADRLLGRVEQYRDGEPEWSHQRELVRSTAPSGQLAIHGTVGGRDVDVDATRAYAVEIDDDPWTALQIFDPDQRFQTYLFLVHEAVPHVPAATYDVGGADDEMSFQVHAELEAEAGASGNVVLTQSSADRVAGWYVVALSDGGSVLGSFDVPVRIRTVYER